VARISLARAIFGLSPCGDDSAIDAGLSLILSCLAMPDPAKGPDAHVANWKPSRLPIGYHFG
jgi:hypothetical protein